MLKTICVDLDGTILAYTGYRGDTNLDPPCPGAREFVTALYDHYEVVIFTTRSNRDAVAAHLDKHDIPYDRVYAGGSKPQAVAFIDDRGVSCRPQVDPDAYTKALFQTHALAASWSCDPLERVEGYTPGCVWEGRNHTGDPMTRRLITQLSKRMNGNRMVEWERVDWDDTEDEPGLLAGTMLWRSFQKWAVRRVR